jgi:hypothetical protein
VDLARVGADGIWRRPAATPPPGPKAAKQAIIEPMASHPATGGN